MMYPCLYKKTATGADQMWQVETDGNKIITRWGQVGGKIQEETEVIKTGKNIGKQNETSPEQQARYEAQALWTKKKTARGYVEKLTDARKGKVDDSVGGGIFPMLAHRFDEQGDKIVYPAFAQPKLDGHRCVAVLKDGVCTLWSRTRKPITSMPHICAEIEQMLPAKSNAIFDGELYNHDYKDRFEELTSLIRPVDPKPGHEIVQYHIFDLAVNGWPFTKRFEALQGFVNGPSLHLVETWPVDDEDTLMGAFSAFTDQGYEGAIVRNANGVYEYRRSYDLQKIKEMKDDEFIIVGVGEGRGKLAGHAIFDCKTKDGTIFAAKMKGSLDELQRIFQNADYYIGRKLTVKYQGYTTKNNVPRFPVGVRVHETL